MQQAEEKIVAQLIRQIIQDGYFISLFDGEEYPVEHNRDEVLILNSIGATDADQIWIERSNHSIVGWIYLVYGNEPEEVICDYTANDYIEQLVDDLELE